MKRIAIIGAGVAALSAANALKSRGYHVEVFEKSRGRGGRTATRRLDFASLDIGAQYFTAKSKIFKQHVRDWQNQGHVSLWPFMPYTIDNNALVVSPDNTDRFVGAPGMSSLCQGLVDTRRPAYDIHLSTHITQLSYSQDHWSLTCDSGEIFTGFNGVIVAIPAEQARALLGSECELATQIPQDLHRPCWAVGLATTGKADLRVQGIFGNETISWVSRQNAKPNRTQGKDYDDLWLLHFSADWSSAHSKDTAQDLEGIARTWLEQYLRTSLNVVHSHRHFWRYANMAKANMWQNRQEPFLFDHSRQLAVIGDWCAGGRVEGAFLSGLGLIEAHF